jgi:hypothetical protein
MSKSLAPAHPETQRPHLATNSQARPRTRFELDVQSQPRPPGLDALAHDRYPEPKLIWPRLDQMDVSRKPGRANSRPRPLAPIVHRALATAGIPRLARSLAPTRIFAHGARGTATQIPYRAEMEQRLGSDFSTVHAHLGQTEAMAALGATAATSGESVVFRDHHPDRKTVAHELVHVVQHRRGLRSATPRPRTAVSKPSDPAEREADRAAEDVVAGRAVHMVEQAGTGILRQEDPGAEHPENVVLARMLPPDMLETLSTGDVSPEALSKGQIEELGKQVLQRLGRARVEELGEVAGIDLPVPEDAPPEEVEAAATRNTIFRQVAETAATMWWLTLVDGPLPIGDIVYGALIITAAVVAAAAADHVRRACSARLEDCLENPMQPESNREDFGPRKDCGACFRECMLAGGIWPSYKCPS